VEFGSGYRGFLTRRTAANDDQIVVARVHRMIQIVLNFV
jgi:hypothetical protein